MIPFLKPLTLYAYESFSIINHQTQLDAFITQNSTLHLYNERFDDVKDENSVETSSSPDTSFDTYNFMFIFMCFVYTISTLSAIITNFIVLLVYLLGHRSKTDLSKFLINLAIADFLQSTFCMPFSFITALVKKWVFGEIMCPIVLFMQILAVSLSIYTMVAIGIDRLVIFFKIIFWSSFMLFSRASPDTRSTLIKTIWLYTKLQVILVRLSKW
jgi:hypothetical protein